MLVQELERSLLRDDENAGNELVLRELRRTIRAAAQPVPRIGDAARLFFAPLEPFLVDSRDERKRIGRIPRDCLEPMWVWIGRDLIPAEAKAVSEDINRALAANDRAKVDQMVRALQECALQRMRDMVDTDEKAQRRLAAQVGTPRAVEALGAAISVLSLRDVLADFGRRLPKHIRAFDGDIDWVKSQLDKTAHSASEDGADRKAEIYLYGLLLVMSRLAAPWQLIRVATRAAESDAAARIAETPYAIAITLVLAETESLIGELRTELKAKRPTVSILKAIHDSVRGLRTEMDMMAESPWSRQLAGIRAEVSNLLKSEIETTPGFVRRLLRPRPAKDIGPGTLLDSIDVNEAEMRVELICTCRRYANELAVNEAAMRVYSELTLYLESATKGLLDSLRHAGDADRAFRQSQVDAAIRFCRIVFGSEYAGLLAKAAEVAAQTGTVERRPLRA